jgi:hypothetical protein
MNFLLNTMSVLPENAICTAPAVLPMTSMPQVIVDTTTRTAIVTSNASLLDVPQRGQYGTVSFTVVKHTLLIISTSFAKMLFGAALPMLLDVQGKLIGKRFRKFGEWEY